MNYRLASAISEYYPAIAVILIILVGIGGFWLHQSSQPRHRTMRDEENIYAYNGSFEHWGKVTENNVLWPVGKVLRNRSTYFPSATPKLRAEFEYRTLGVDSANGTLRLSAFLVLSSVGEEEEGEEILYWSDTENLIENSWNLSEGFWSLEFPELVIPQIKERIENIQRDLDFRGGSTEVNVVVKARMDGEINGNRVARTETYEMPINLERSTYSVGTDLSRSESVTKIITRSVKEEAPFAAKVPSILLVIASLLGLGYLTLQWRTIDASELKRLKVERERGKYDEWISEGKLPKLDVKASVEIKSLGGLVDLAVDLDRRVIYDEEKSIYFFVHEDMLYSYKIEE